MTHKMGISIPLEWNKIYQIMGKHRIKTTAITHTDPTTGEIDERIESIELENLKTEPFFLTYSKQICAFYNMSIFNATVKVLWKLLEYAEWNTGKVYMPADRKDEIMHICGISNTSYYRAIEELVEAGIITKGRGVYSINSAYFWKGSEKARRDIIKANANLIFVPQYND